MTTTSMSRGLSIFLLAIVIVAWGINWTVGKSVLNYLPPIWATAVRTTPACLLLWVIALCFGKLAKPTRGDLPMILSVGLLHMVAFSVLASVGLQYLPAGRSVVLAYTTPLWVFPAAWYFLGEPLDRRRLAGLAIGMVGLAVLLRPASFDWTNRDVLMGHGLILLAALCWAGCIVYGRAHKWIHSPFQLLPWQTLTAAASQLLLALVIEGVPDVRWSAELLMLLAYSSMIGTVLAYWAMNNVNRALPASVTSMALLGVPVFGLLFSGAVLGEHISPDVLAATALIVMGIAIGASPALRSKTSA